MYSPDIVVGPDYGLSFLNKDGKINFSLRNKIIKGLEEISLDSPRTLLIPGTTPFLLVEGKMGHSAMIFRGGEKIEEFRKETDIENCKIAKKNCLEYERGDSSKNKVYYDGKKITVEICSDHGKQAVDKDTFLEVILTYDDNAGFWIRANNDDFARWAVLSDGRKPMVGCFRFNPKLPKHYGILKGKKLNSSLYLFNLNERNVSYF